MKDTLFPRPALIGSQDRRIGSQRAAYLRRLAHAHGWPASVLSRLTRFYGAYDIEHIRDHQYDFFMSAIQRKDLISVFSGPPLDGERPWGHESEDMYYTALAMKETRFEVLVDIVEEHATHGDGMTLALAKKEIAFRYRRARIRGLLAEADAEFNTLYA